MKYTTIYALLVTVCFVLFVACNKDDNDVDTCAGFVYGEEIADEAQALSEAAIAYGQNATPETCQAYKEAFQDYIDELQHYENCIPASDHDQWEQSLEEAEQDLKELNCN